MFSSSCWPPHLRSKPQHKAAVLLIKPGRAGRPAGNPMLHVDGRSGGRNSTLLVKSGKPSCAPISGDQLFRTLPLHFLGRRYDEGLVAETLPGTNRNKGTL